MKTAFLATYLFQASLNGAGENLIKPLYCYLFEIIQNQLQETPPQVPYFTQ